ncbi:MAG: HAD-IC family P-type ATPase [Firmicutes bacterium]|nr:HAD-IC family P-type ATPase [Bacillota bacterium]
MKKRMTEEELLRIQSIPRLKADPAFGLSDEQARERLQAGLGNTAPAGATLSEKDIVLRHCFTFFNMIFLFLALVLAVSGSSVKNMTFLIVAACNTGIGIFQQIRAKRAVDALTLVSAGKFTAVRGGTERQLPDSELVRDDIVIFHAGDQICADGEVRAGELYVNESLLTGEADAVKKVAGDSLKSGSFVITGTARVQLTQVGGEAFAAKLAQQAKANPRATKTGMARSLDKLLLAVSFALVPVGIALFWQHYWDLGLDLQTSAESTVSALIGMIPEGLYLLTSVAMAVSALKLTRQKVLVQDMNCIESLARVDVLCVDKTGTITESRMEVENVLPLTDDPPERLEAILSAVYSTGSAENETAKAMAEMFAQGTSWVQTRYVPFSSETKWSGCEFEGQGAFVIGAPEFIMGSRYGELEETVAQWASQGCRCLLAAQYGGTLSSALESGKLTPLALIMLTNRIRPEAADTFAYFASQGVAVKVISGDNPLTVSQVARRAGIPGSEDYIDLSTVQTPEALAEATERYTVFGRVTPDQKRALVKAMQRRRHTVAMTGDGVNDVLAMKEADCSIAMAGGAQAASQVARLVLTDADFSAMPGIVDEGRRVINNIRRAATLFLVKNIFSLGLSLLTLVTNWQYPLIPLHLSVISSLTIGIPSFFLAMEPNYERVSGSFLPSVLRKALPGGLTNIFVVLMAQAFGEVFSLPQEEISTVCASILAVVGLLVLYQVSRPSNRFRRLVWFAMAAALVVCFTALRDLFELESGNAESLLVMVTLLIMTPTVFFSVQGVFDWADRLTHAFRERLHCRRAA